ncbi:T9SS type A sorting domain-containing protein [Winogradskyella sp. MH6]|uniref:T9SS type A sorting domain-containing protein n=1 Tax=Winogradskyella sp. MH6 TaxID=2929510 RepID=UPI001FB2E461|nr:T9SS type A sorting domain-containing protein [Winogradskyella sp. MH6]
MKNTFLLVALSLFGLSAYGQDYRELIREGNHTIQHISEVAEQHFDSVGRGRGTGFKNFKRWQYFAERAMDETGKLKSPEFYYEELENYNASINSEGLAARTTVGTWEEMGPTYWDATSGWNPGVGRITSLAVDESNLNHILAGSETGGVWKSTDGGMSWTVLSDNLANIDVYALAIDPSDSNTYYWGSTSGAIFKSTDGGSTWSSLGGLAYGVVNKILVDPTNAMKVYASVQGNGLYKSTDGGATWSSIYFVATGTGYDFEFKPNDPSVVYASGNAFYVSTNGGASFTQISGSGVDQFSNGPKMIGVSADNPNIVYVLEADGGLFGALYTSSDSGSSFTKLTHTQNFFGYDSNGNDALGQAPRDMDITVNPNDVDDVHIAGINTWRSIDGGASFSITSQWVPSVASGSGIGYCHADVDIMHFAGTGTDAKLYVGTDGGIYRADNPTIVSSGYYTDLTPGLGIRQFYKIGVSQTDPVVVTGGSQDNGTSTLREDGLWSDWLGADGMEGFVDKDNAAIMYGTTQFGSLYRTEYNVFGSNVASLSQPDGKGGDYNWNWVVPFEQDPIVQNTIYVTFDEVYKSVDSGTNWVSISPNFGDSIDHFKIAPSNNQIMYCAINGVLRFSVDGGASWTVSPLSIGSAIINEIAVHPSNPNKVAIATTNSQKVYVSSDGGLTWTSKLMNLPGFVAQALAWQDNGDDGLYVGMNYGVFYTDNTLTEWEPFNNGLPNVRINELEINTADNKIYAATYGRGLWRSSLYDSSLSVNDFVFSDLSLYPNPAKSEVNLKWNKPEDVSIRIFDAQGKIMFFGKKVNLFNGFKVDVSSFNSGIYFVKLNSNNGEITKKLILN